MLLKSSPAMCLVAGLLVQGALAGQRSAPAVPQDPIEAILGAFKTHQVVTLPGGHAGIELHELLLKLIRDPRFPALVNDIVVEFGSARYQDLMDRFVRGDEIDDRALRQVWFNTTNLHFLRREILSNYDMSGWQAQTIVSLLEASGHKVFVIFGDGAGVRSVQPEAASWPHLSVTLVKGTGLGAADFAAINPVETRYAIRGADKFEPIPKSEWRSLRTEEQVDAIIYLGKGGTTAQLSPTLCADPNYENADRSNQARWLARRRS